MKNRVVSKVIAGTIAAMMVLVFAIKVMGTSPEPEVIKLVPSTVSSDSSLLPSKLAKSETDGIWRLFDRDTDTAYTPKLTSRVIFSLSDQRNISRIKVYGAASYSLNVYRDNSGLWEPVTSLSGMNLEQGVSSWNTYRADEPFTATRILLEFIPLGNIALPLREIEIWGDETSASGDSTLTLEGLVAPKDLEAMLSEKPSNITEFSALPSELSVSENSERPDQPFMTVTLAQNPSLFKRAYLVYDGYGILRPVSIQRRINGLAWAGGFDLPKQDDAAAEWTTHLEEINPAWLIQGENRIEFGSTNGTVRVRNLKLIGETDSGWNSVSYVSDSSVYDEDVATSYAVSSSSSMQINFERQVQPESIKLHVNGPMNAAAGLQYLSGSQWLEVKTGWQINLSALNSGWNEIAIPVPVTTNALRLLFNTGSTRIKGGAPVGSINELKISSSPAGTSSAPRIVVSYPRNGEYFGRTAYIQGFVAPAVNSSGVAAVTIEGKQAQHLVPDGSFSLSLNKDETSFYAQSDDEAWTPVINVEYGGQQAASHALALYKNASADEKKEPEKESRDDASFAEKREKYSEKVSPGQAKKIKYKGVTLDIPEGAVDTEMEITIIPLTEADLARLDPGMVNVTFPAAGYRLLPHGTKFKKPIKLSFGYSKTLFAAGQTDDEVNMYFYNEANLQWERLSRVGVDNTLYRVTSQTDHFTDIINGTLVVPEHPQALSFNPNSIKDIKAGDPSSGVNLIEAPKGNNMGDARLSYPIEIPKGRNGMQPNLAVSYNSGGGNGWLGLGWDLNAPSITIDTRWGVPRYDAANETETYMLDGDQLMPVAHRGALQPRSAEKTFHPRTEGQFRKIVRHGTAPSNYWWEVTDKNGTKFFYGGSPESGLASDSILATGGDSGNIFKWALRETRDTNGNYIRYKYALVQDSGIGNGTGGVTGYQFCLKTITYTGHGNSDGPYTITFIRDRDLNESRRPDVSIDARGGFKTVTADLLRRIEVHFKDRKEQDFHIRSYSFDYSSGAFHKTLLKSVSQYGADGTLFNTHTFEYFDDITSDNGYNGFYTSTQWNTRDDHLDNKYLGVPVGPSALSGSEGISGGGSFSIGFAPPPTKYLSFNGMIGSGMSNSKGTLQLVDIDGDGLSDKVYEDGGIKYHRNTANPKMDPSISVKFDDKATEIKGMGVLSEDESINFNVGGQAYIAGLNLILDLGTSFTMQRSYLSDVNGDGLVDVVSNGKVLFNHWKDKEKGDYTLEFSATSAGTESPIAAGSVDPTGMLPETTFSSIETRLMEDNPRMDVVRRWKAPYSGRVAIDGDVRLVDILNDPDATTEEKQKRQSYTTADGVRVAIERPGLTDPLWRQDIAANDFASYTPTNTGSIDVNKGDVIYFRVQSNFDGAYDEVKWSPRARYVETTEGGTVAVEATDANKLDPYVFKADREFVYAGRISPMEMPFRGKVRLTGTLDKTAITSDDVRISIYRFNDSEIETYFKNRRDYMLMHTNRTPVARYSMRWDETGGLTLDGTPDIEVAAKDKLFIIVEIDSNIDLTKLQWSASDPLRAFYTEANRTNDQPTDENGGSIKDKDGNPSGWEPGSPIQVQDSDGKYIIQLAPQQEMNFYPDNDLNQAQSDFAVAETGWLMVNPQVKPKPVAVDDEGVNIIWKYPFHHTTEMVFTAKQIGELAGKRVLSFPEGAEYEPLQQSFAVPVYKGDRIFFDFSTRDPEIYPTIESTGVSVHYIRPNYTVTLNNVPVNKTNRVSEWQSATGTATVMPALTAKADAPALSGEVVLHVSYEYYEDGSNLPVIKHVIDRRIDFDTQTPFNPYAHAFDLPAVVGRFIFSYSVENTDIEAALDAHAVTIMVQTAYNATQREFTGLDLFVVPPAPDTDTGKALLPVGASAAKVAIAPVIKQDGVLVSALTGSATLTVARRFTVIDTEGKPHIQEAIIAQQPVFLTAGKRFNPGEHVFDVYAQANDTLVMYFATDDSTLAALSLDWGLWTQPRRHTGDGVSVSTPSSMLHRYGYWDLFASSYRGWAYAGYNSEGMYHDVALKDQPIVPSRLTVSSNESDYQVPTDHDAATSKRVKDMTAFPAVPQPEYSRWFAGDESWRIKADRMRSSRMGLDYVHLPRASELASAVQPEPNGGGAGATAPPRMSIVELESTMGVGFIVNINHTETPGQGLLDFMDMNGDRFPDVVGGNTIQYTEMVGGLGSKRGNTGTSYVRDSFSTADNIAPGGTVQQAIANAKGYFNPKDGNANQSNKNSSFGITGSLGSRNNDVKADYIDMNGDGLSDRVYDRNGEIWVALNMGYGFAEEEHWGRAVVDDSKTKYINAGASYNDGVKGYAGSISLTHSLGKTNKKLIDMNGDGLPDRVSEGNGGLKVGINTGNGFTEDRIWTGSASLGDNQSFSLNGGLSLNFTIGPLCIAACYIDLNPGISLSTNSARAESAIQDVNGDGYPDSLASIDENSLTVAINKTGRTNLLKSVTRPLGGGLDIEYERTGNTYDMPQSKWIMTDVKLSDGMGNEYDTKYSYGKGYQDRYERDFYGFDKVVETQAPGTAIERTVTQAYDNRNYFLKGLVQKSVTTDNQGMVWAKTANTYELADVKDGNNVIPGSFFSALKRTDTYYYTGTYSDEGNYIKATFQEYGYDDYGNVASFIDRGDSGADDDVYASIHYWKDPDPHGYIVGKPDVIEVRDTNGKVLRKRWATYENGTGNLIYHTTLVTANQNATWEMTYDPYGNITSITDPVGYRLEYTYDPETFTYVTRVQDNLDGAGGPYYSIADYNLLYGQLAWSRDLNGNYQVNRYDEFGRLVTVHGPYDTNQAGMPVGTPTIAFEYRMPVLDSVANNILSPASAVTKNKAVSRIGSDGNTLDTITYADGMRRIIQTKKEADVNGTYGMVVSGKVIFDLLGRTILQGQPIFETGYQTAFTPQFAPHHPTLFAYDILDRTWKTVAPDSATTTISYDFGSIGNSGTTYFKTTVVDPEGNKIGGANRRGTKVTYKDVDERIQAVVEYESGHPITTTYDYDPLGQITKVKDNNVNITTVEYDYAGRRTSITNLDTGKTQYEYDANGNLTAKATENHPWGKEIRYEYIMNRLVKINYPYSPDVEYQYGAMGEAYNRAGRIKKIEDESGIEERYYGRLGETTKEEKTVTAAKTPPVSNKKFTTDYAFDSFGRMLEMTYPDGEKLKYAYDNGGLLKAAWGEKSSNRYNYINTLQYDEFGQRTNIQYGNGVKSKYTYDSLTRRLDTLVTTTSSGQTIQNMTYNYDLVGNVLDLNNQIQTPTNTALPAGPVAQKFDYDDLYQLTSATGSYSFGPGKQNKYTNVFQYDTIGNMTKKVQIHKIIQPSAQENEPKLTNYNLDYIYGSTKPHAVTDAGDKLYSYDNNGNMTGWEDKQNHKKRTIHWNEENRITQIDDQGKSTYFAYDDSGERVIKRGQHGETLYINRFYAVRNGELGTKNIYAGETRVLSKLVKTPNTVTANSSTSTFTSTSQGFPNQGTTNALQNGNGKKLGIIKRLGDNSVAVGVTQPVEKDQFYYHGDHLGSSNMITNAYGEVYQHLEYFPYGESWIEEGGSYGGNTPGFKFTGKELDPETGLYYFGARYYEPVISKWISADPILNKYLPSGDKDKDKRLPGRGGVFRPINLNLFIYAHQNPLMMVDPDGWATIVIDPGHGDVYNKWLDPGATGIGDKAPHEKDYALQLSKSIGAGLEKLGHTVIYTRTGDIKEKQERLQWRADISNEADADYFISVHLNSMDEKKNYFMVGYASETGKKIAESIVTEVNQDGFSKIVAEKHGYKILKLTDAPAVLIEAGNIKNPENAKILSDKSFIEQIVKGIDEATK